MRLVIAYDGSASAATAIRVAAGLFAGAEARIATVPRRTELHVGTGLPMVPGVSPGVLQQTLEEIEAEARREAEETARRGVEAARALGLQAEVAAVAAGTSESAALLGAARELEADVLVCGTRGRGAFTRALLGSTSSSLLHNADLPLLVVPDGGGTLDGPLIAAYDGSEGAARAIEVAGRLLNGRATVVVHAWEAVFRRALAARALAAGPLDEVGEIIGDLHEAVADRATAVTQEGVAAARAAGLDATGEPVESDEGAWRSIAGVARTHGASAVVVGTRGLGAARSALLGSVSSGLVQNADLPVLVVPAGPAAD